MIIYNGDLIAGGRFNLAGGDTARCVARWNGTTWSPIGVLQYSNTSTVLAFTVFNGDLIAGGQFRYSSWNYRGWIAKWNGTSWSKLGSGMGSGSTPFVQFLTNFNGNLIAGRSFSTAGGVVVKGIAKWNGTYWDSLGSGIGITVQVLSLTPYNGNLIAGGVFSQIGTLIVNHIVKWTPPTGIKVISGEIPERFTLFQNYPNPFNPSTNIRFDITKSSHVKIIVYNSLGKEVAALVDEKLSTGSYEVSWDGSSYSGGVYFYKLIADDFINVKKMVLLK